MNVIRARELRKIIDRSIEPKERRTLASLGCNERTGEFLSSGDRGMEHLGNGRRRRRVGKRTWGRMDVVPPNRDTATTHAPGVSLGGRLVADMGATNGRASPWCPRVTRRKRTALPATLGSGCKQDVHGRPGRQVREDETKAEETSNAKVGRGAAFEGNVGEVWGGRRDHGA